MKSLLLTAAVSALALGANAQISLIPEAGVNLANIRSTVAGEKSTSSTKAGFRGGVNVGIAVGNNLSIQPGIFFSQKGGSQETMGVTTQSVINYVEIPVNLVYYFMEDQSGFFLNAGAYAAAAVSGYGKIGDQKIDYSIGGDEAKDDIRRWDVGFQGGAGYQTKMGLMLRAQYILGAMNISSHNNSDYSTRNGAINISLGYKFGW
ncbi:MAG: PorT family protein [Sphingobacteriales bacterium]|nr:MAG: PorT family protein [Sphingobacteriales bacterium]